MMWVVGLLFVLVVVLGLALYAVVTNPVQPTGQPTPDEARITNQAATETAKIEHDSDARKEVIKHADRKSLFALARDRLRKK